jgi:aspartyl-tRNA(Asn)/glutamyl-tRNA(Gln) amidotransferase subunit A
MKPTYGRVSRWGLVAFASSLDQIGPIAHTAEDCALVLDCIGGPDSRDSTCFPTTYPDCFGALNAGLSNLVVGLPKEYFQNEGVDPEVLDKVLGAVKHLESAGAELREVSLPHSQYAVSAYYLVATAEASSNLARYDGARYGKRSSVAKSLADMYESSRSEGFGEEVKRRILLGTYVLSAGYYDAYYRKAQKVRTLLRRDFQDAFLECDVIATPTCPEVAFSLGSKLDPLAMYLSDVFTVSANLVGVPGVSIPCGFKDGLPVGLQLLGKAGDDATPLRIAHEFQQTTDFHREVPPGVTS